MRTEDIVKETLNKVAEDEVNHILSCVEDSKITSWSFCESFVKNFNKLNKLKNYDTIKEQTEIL